MAGVDINHNEWVNFDSTWFYKVDHQEISIPFQRKFYMTNTIQKINDNPEITFKVDELEQDQYSLALKAEKIEKSQNILRKILNLEASTAIEDWTHDTGKRNVIEDILASNHIKILFVI